MRVSRRPRISVVMAVFNGLPYLKNSVESILGQTYTNFELIIVDDASTDKSWKYLKSIKDRRVKLLKNTRNLGLAASLNLALLKSSGAYIARMDADDISLPRRLEIQLNFLLTHPSVEICGTWVNLMDENGKIITTIKMPTKDSQIKQRNKWTPALIHPTWMGNSRLFKNLGGYDPKFDTVEDLDFLLRAKQSEMANIDKCLLLWRTTTSRRSKSSINTMYKKSLEVRWKYFKKGEFSILYIPLLLRSVISTYLFPSYLKIFLNKKSGLL